MGNCIRHESQAQWGGEDWSTLLSNDEEPNQSTAVHSKGKMGNSTSSATSTTTTTEVKVRITKKQLDKLLSGLDLHHQDGLSVQQVLGQLMKLSTHYEAHQRPGWRPRLQSIPEI